MISGDAYSINALYVCEVQSVMEGGAYGDLQRWQLTIIHLSFGERKLWFENKDLAIAGSFYKGKNMDKISECASSFKKLCDVSYKFIVSFQRKTREINLNFQESDFFHLAGLQYIFSQEYYV